MSATTPVLRYIFVDTDAADLALPPKETTNLGFQVLVSPPGQLVHFDAARCEVFSD